MKPRVINPSCATSQSPPRGFARLSKTGVALGGALCALTLSGCYYPYGYYPSGYYSPYYATVPATAVQQSGAESTDSSAAQQQQADAQGQAQGQGQGQQQSPTYAVAAPPPVYVAPPYPVYYPPPVYPAYYGYPGFYGPSIAIGIGGYWGGGWGHHHHGH
jgi:hypothetical protein